MLTNAAIPNCAPAATSPTAPPLPTAPPGGALLICEMLLAEDGTSPPEVLLQSLNMLAQTHGRERRLSEYAHLCAAAGFCRVEGRRTGSYLDAVIAYKDDGRGSAEPMGDDDDAAAAP